MSGRSRIVQLLLSKTTSSYFRSGDHSDGRDTRRGPAGRQLDSGLSLSLSSLVWLDVPELPDFTFYRPDDRVTACE